MTSSAVDLFLLATSLSQIKDRMTVTRLFVEGLDRIFPELGVGWEDIAEPRRRKLLEVCTRRGCFGVLSYSIEVQPDETTQALLHNACQLLGVIIERLEQEELLLEQKKALEVLVEERTKIAQELELRVAQRTRDLEVSNKSLIDSRLAALNMMEDAIMAREHAEETLVSLRREIAERKRAEEEQERLQSQLIQSQKMESVGRLAGGVAHDFNNMLGVILGHAEMALEQLDPSEPLHADLEEIRKAAARSADLTRQLLAFARKQVVSPKVLDLNTTVGRMLTMLKRLMGEDIDLIWIPGKELWPVKVDPSQIDQMLANLCVNARDAVVEGVGKVTIETENSAFDEAYCDLHAGFTPGQYVLLAVSDNGCGMDHETISHVFEPFFTTKEVAKGTGLGLATVYGAVKQNNGFIHVYSEPGRGTTFKIYLPSHQARTEHLPEGEPVQPAVCGRETVLLVEDEPAILQMTTRMLERMGYTVLAANRPGEAMRLAETHPGQIHLLMTDVVMPEMNGRDLAKNLISLYPNLRRLFMSGYTANVIAHHGVLDEGVHFIQKPFSKEELAARVRKALEE
jgi:signal transduction histidine kinase